MRTRIIHQELGESRDCMTWAKFLYEYRVKEYIWEKIAEGDVHSLKEFDLATVYCHVCGVTACDCRCRHSWSDNGL